MKLEFRCHVTAYGASDAPLSAEQCRAAGLDGLETPLDLARWLDDPLIADAGLNDAGIRLALDKNDLRGVIAFVCPEKLNDRQIKALTRALEGQLLDGAGEDHRIETTAGEIQLAWLERRGRPDRASSLKQIADGAAVADTRPPHWMKFAEQGDVEALRRELDKGADVNARDRWRATALMLAAREGHEACVELLIGRGASIDRVSESGSTALGLTAMSGHTAIARLLLSAGADPLIGDKPALHWAANRGHIELCRTLLESGANVSAVDDRGQTALFLTPDRPILELLIEAGADLAFEDPHGLTAFQNAEHQAGGFERFDADMAAGWRVAAEVLRSGAASQQRT